MQCGGARVFIHLGHHLLVIAHAHHPRIARGEGPRADLDVRDPRLDALAVLLQRVERDDSSPDQHLGARLGFEQFDVVRGAVDAHPVAERARLIQPETIACLARTQAVVVGARHRRHRKRGLQRIVLARQQLVVVALDEAGVDGARPKLGVVENAREEADVVVHANDIAGPQRADQAVDGLRAIAAMGDHLGDHRIVERGHCVALPHAGIHTNAFRVVRQTQPEQLARRREEVLTRVLGVQPHFHRMAVNGQVLLPERQRLTGCHAQLQFHEIQLRDELGHRMFNLQARIHFHEIRFVALDDELDRADPFVVDCLRGAHCGIAQIGAHLRGKIRCRRFFHHLLMATLHGAVPLKQVNTVTVAVRQHLHFDVPGPVEIAFDQYVRIAEGRRRLAPCALQRLAEFLRRSHDAHAASATARGRLDEHRKTDARRGRLQ